MKMAGSSVMSRRVVLSASGCAVLAACGPVARGPAVPIDNTRRATVLGLANERFFIFSDTAPLEREILDAMERRRQTLGLRNVMDMPQLNLLAVSGGGENGAFGAGLLCGWSVQGTRPTFEWVTGVSTGALTAPFAFLGSADDPQL